MDEYLPRDREDAADGGLPGLRASVCGCGGVEREADGSGVVMTKIEWCDETINPIIGCTKISEGCENCYAERMAWRLAMNPTMKGRYGETIVVNPIRATAHWSGKTSFIPSELEKPSRWKKPKRIFVGSMGDVFHESVPTGWILEILLMAEKNPNHTFILLTKRPENALMIFDRFGLLPIGPKDETGSGERIPENIWLGVTVENQEQADKRIPELLQIPVKVRFASVEPMLGPVDMSDHMARYREVGTQTLPLLDWVICGAETGPKARIMHSNWAEDLEAQCKRAKIPFFFKKWSGPGWGNMPRQFPE